MVRGLDRIQAPGRAEELWPTPREDTWGTHRSSLFDRQGNPRPLRPALSFIRSLSRPTARLPDGPASPEPRSPSRLPESAGALTTMDSAKVKSRSIRPGPAQDAASQSTCSNLGRASVASQGRERSLLAGGRDLPAFLEVNRRPRRRPLILTTMFDAVPGPSAQHSTDPCNDPRGSLVYTLHPPPRSGRRDPPRDSTSPPPTDSR